MTFLRINVYDQTKNLILLGAHTAMAAPSTINTGLQHIKTGTKATGIAFTKTRKAL